MTTADDITLTTLPPAAAPDHPAENTSLTLWTLERNEQAQHYQAMVEIERNERLVPLFDASQMDFFESCCKQQAEDRSEDLRRFTIDAERLIAQCALAARFKNLLKSSGMTSSAVAEKAGVNRGNLSSWQHKKLAGKSIRTRLQSETSVAAISAWCTHQESLRCPHTPLWSA